MYLTELAKQLDSLASQIGAHISEDNELIVVSNLNAAAAGSLSTSCMHLGWGWSVFDEAGEPTSYLELVDDFAPFRVSIRKPASSPGVLDIVSRVGFTQLLERGHAATLWRIAGLDSPLQTHARIYTGWTSIELPIVSPAGKSPRSLVRESGEARNAPADIRPWLLVDPAKLDLGDPFHKIWSVYAVCALSGALAHEIDALTSELIFKGPPKLILRAPTRSDLDINGFGGNAFIDLHAAAEWVYENSREAETRHNFLATEIARAGREVEDFHSYIKLNISTALESAKIAYQMSVSEISKDTLKSLADLRKAITEETAKATEATRQTAAAVASALAVGVGLFAARLSADIKPWLIVTVSIIAISYVSMVVFSGWSFINLQRDLRSDWRNKIYRYLPVAEYKKMVEQPALKSERVFKISAIIGVMATVVMCSSVTLFGFFSGAHAQFSNRDDASRESDRVEKSTVSGLAEIKPRPLVGPRAAPSPSQWSPLLAPKSPPGN